MPRASSNIERTATGTGTRRPTGVESCRARRRDERDTVECSRVTVRCVCLCVCVCVCVCVAPWRRVEVRRESRHHRRAEGARAETGVTSDV